MTNEPIIVGAGFSGLIAGYMFPRATILEAGVRKQHHQALLRFRTDHVAKATGTEFKAVNVRKGIFLDGAFHEPNVRVANLYSKKVLGGRLVDRSIWDIEPCTRFIAPADFHDQLVDGLGSRVEYQTPFDFEGFRKLDAPVITTAPLPITLAALGITHEAKFEKAKIDVLHAEVKDAGVYQTIYFPNPAHSLYRASITGDKLICEFVESQRFGSWRDELYQAFGITKTDVQWTNSGSQEYGKIETLAPAQRRAILANLTQNHGVYSLGRFATWRNILLDDVVQDAEVIKRLIRSDSYEGRLACAR